MGAWIQFLADIKRTRGKAAVDAYLSKRALNYELKNQVLPLESCSHFVVVTDC